MAMSIMWLTYGKIDAIVEDEVTVGLNTQQKNIQEQYDCIDLNILVNHLITVRLVAITDHETATDTFNIK